MRRTISWSVGAICAPGGCRSPLRAASPFRWGCGVPLAAGGWCMSAAGGCGGGGDSLRVRLRGGRWPAPSSPESVEARLALEPRRPRRWITRVSAASASPSRPSDVTAHHHPDLSSPYPFVLRDAPMLRFSILPRSGYAARSISPRNRKLVLVTNRFEYRSTSQTPFLNSYTKIS